MEQELKIKSSYIVWTWILAFCSLGWLGASIGQQDNGAAITFLMLSILALIGSLSVYKTGKNKIQRSR